MQRYQVALVVSVVTSILITTARQAYGMRRPKEEGLNIIDCDEVIVVIYRMLTKCKKVTKMFHASCFLSYEIVVWVIF